MIVLLRLLSRRWWRIREAFGHRGGLRHLDRLEQDAQLEKAEFADFTVDRFPEFGAPPGVGAKAP
ncbi:MULTISPECIES: hypothetical protein [unclassified Nocardioides]|uniref:hypothetical protein n=1 Tax=unclassified Nocardioides TaxID=2615069 RepID=UPI0009F0C5A3